MRKSNFLRNVYGPIAAAAGLAGVRFHDRRHDHAGMLIELGVDAKVVQQRIGRKDVGTTPKYSGHLREEAHRAAADKFDGLFKARQGREARGRVKRLATVRLHFRVESACACRQEPAENST